MGEETTMEVTVGELQQMSRFWNESIMQKRKSDSLMGVGLGIIMGAMTVIGLFAMGTETSLFHTFVPTLFVIYGGYRIFAGAAAAKKSKAALKQVGIFGEEKEEILQKTLEEMRKFSGEDEDSFSFMEVMGKARGNQTVLKWKGKFNGDMLTLMKEPKDEIYFLLIDEMSIDVGKKVMHNDGYMQLGRRQAKRAVERGEVVHVKLGNIKEVKLDTSENDHYATARFADREIQGEISAESIRKFEKWKKGEYPQTTENGEPFPIWSFKPKKKSASKPSLDDAMTPAEE